MKHKKVKLFRWVLRICEKENLQIVIGMIFFTILFVYNKKYVFKLSDLLDLTLIASFVFLYIIKLLSGILSSYLKNQLEDHMKLETDSNRLIKKYPLENGFVTYNNKMYIFKDYARDKSGSNTLKKNGKDSYVYKFPVVINYEKNHKNIVINDKKDNYYELNEIAKENYTSLFNSHSTSDVYNQVNVRLDRFEEIEDELHLFTSRTTFYDSLVTNRAIDFEFQKGMTLRNMLNPGPFIVSLDESKLSNHLGFNVFIETLDGDIIFVKRSMNVSIGKGSLGPSIAASLKTRYCLNDDLSFTIDGLEKAVEEEIKDELGLNTSSIKISLKEHLIAIYRDILEGGKPQFLFKAKVNYTSDEVKENFKKYLKEKNDKYDTIKDGDKLVFINTSDLSRIFIAPDTIFFGKKKYSLLPAVAGTFAYYISHWRSESNENN
ncbi:hypothetical protein GCM10012290_25650 [Halolactibacillus alkaliphilus]|uniref:Uncharacterized protein n=1 Tax=Halolactibacillus alkaliphilus TaxID=442899 RepID=A0A511X509_9BACI|nr:hypothetical protein [Halolactibacillus alkaliphilus]GEN58037.1 hypothetical protein HAL01_25010 [Halolactibacillus alkaliphilus]GGN76187.1 hypothetical protein GCM10012290_25650 [Halolactibacillus alkaliphilus]SFP11396.1 hypothetical protein SAMN05720591_1517 [Halolactibacillus alkaliphilus]